MRWPSNTSFTKLQPETVVASAAASVRLAITRRLLILDTLPTHPQPDPSPVRAERSRRSLVAQESRWHVWPLLTRRGGHCCHLDEPPGQPRVKPSSSGVIPSAASA